MDFFLQFLLFISNLPSLYYMRINLSQSSNQSLVYDLLRNYIETATCIISNFASRLLFGSIHFSPDTSFLTVLGDMQNMNASL